MAAALFLSALSACGGTDPVQGSGNNGSGAWNPAQSGGTGSSGGEDAEDSGIYDLFSDTEDAISLGTEFFTAGKSAQYYQGEPVVLAVTRSGMSADVCLYRREGEKELLLAGLPSDVYTGDSFLDEEGGYYHIQKGFGKEPFVITKYDASGKPVYSIKKEGAELQLCGLPEGIIALYYRDNATNQRTLELLDAGTGTVSSVPLKQPPATNTYIGSDGKDLYFLDSHGISRIDLKEGGTAGYLSFTGTSYSLPVAGSLQSGNIRTFRVKGAREAEILLERSLSLDMAASLELPVYTMILESLWEEKPDPAKTILTLRGIREPSWKEYIAEFNRTNGTYHVVVETNDESVSDEDYIRRTSVEMGAGQGPDILYGEQILGRSQLYSLTQKGALEDLTPYMERSGIRRGDYLPAAFIDMGSEGKVYGINTTCNMTMLAQTADGSLPEGAAATDIRGFADAFLTLGDQALFARGYDPYELLQAFLEGSDSLWGMADWEKDSCTLDQELFPKLLQVAKNLGENDRKSYEPAVENIYTLFLLNYKQLFDPKVLGWPFDDGFYGRIDTELSLMVNANSKHKEGAWELISYLLSTETQETSYVEWRFHGIPVNKKAIGLQAKRLAEDPGYVYYTPMTEEDVAAVTTFLE